MGEPISSLLPAVSSAGDRARRGKRPQAIPYCYPLGDTQKVNVPDGLQSQLANIVVVSITDCNGSLCTADHDPHSAAGKEQQSPLEIL